MEYKPIEAPIELQKADYNIYRYTDQIYKVVKFKSTAPYRGLSGKAPKQTYDHKLDASVSRARRVVLELALCNDWSYFCTFTLDQKKFDRSNLKEWHKKFTQWLRDQRKKYNIDFSFVLVPEQHQDGSWHMHGLFGDISPLLISFKDMWDRGERVKYDLVKGGYYNWPDYQKKFGFCSFGKISNKVAVAFYVTKYISKTIGETLIPVGSSLYYPSRGLNHATFHGDVYGECIYLNQFLRNHYEFCSTGMTHLKNDLDWSFAMDYMDFETMEVFSSEELPETEVQRFEEYFETVQTVMDEFN